MHQKEREHQHLRGLQVRQIVLNLLVLLLSGALFTACATADLRTSQIEESGISTDLALKGRTILEAAAQRHGLNNWRKHQTTEIIMRDDWDSFLASLAGLVPWDNEDKIRFQFQNGTFNARVEFLEGDRQGTIWGLQSWQAYKITPDEGLVFEEDDMIEFILPAEQYFTELPFRILSAPIMSYAGSKQLNNKDYDLVYATWGKAEPHSENDQYILWVNKESGLVELVEYTVRDQFDFVSAANFYSDFRTIDGITVAFQQSICNSVEDSAEEDYLHMIKIESLTFDAFDIKLLTPNPDIPHLGDQKPAASE